jgi:hypothetical protein
MMKNRPRGTKAFLQSTSVQRTSVQNVLCIHKEHIVTSIEFYSLEYYNRFYLYTLVPAESGEFCDTVYI